MKLEIFGGATAAFFAVLGAFLADNGSSLLIMVFALIGTIVALLELDPFKWRVAITLFLFNGLVGTFGGPVLLVVVGVDPASLPAPAIILLPFLLGWAAHTALSQLRNVLISQLKKRMGETGQ